MPPVAVTGAELRWDGTSFPSSTCSGTVGCYQRRFAPAGHYVARMCATPGTLLAVTAGSSVCSNTAPEECVDVPFDLPGPSPVEGALPTLGAHACTSPETILVGDGAASLPGDTGFDRCADGAVRRRAAMACPLGPGAAVSPCNATDGQCASDVDCAAAPHGLCANGHRLLGYCGCFYGCMKDADCAAGTICSCGDPVGACVPASCVDSTTCPPGLECASSSSGCGGGMSAFACQVAADQCLGDSDCGMGKRCVLQGGHRGCVTACLLPPAP